MIELASLRGFGDILLDPSEEGSTRASQENQFCKKQDQELVAES